MIDSVGEAKTSAAVSSFPFAPRNFSTSSNAPVPGPTNESGVRDDGNGVAAKVVLWW